MQPEENLHFLYVWLNLDKLVNPELWSSCWHHYANLTRDFKKIGFEDFNFVIGTYSKVLMVY